MNPATQQEPAPTGNGAEVWPMVIDDMRERHAFGKAKYGTALRAGNGRDTLVDWYQEILDAAVYARTEIENRKNAAEAERAAIVAYIRTLYTEPGLLSAIVEDIAAGKHHDIS